MASSGSTSSIRRIQRELKEISEDPSRHWTAAPVSDDLFEWQFAVRGPPGTDFEGGIFTGRLALPVNYPLAPPSIMLLTPNGRWEVGKKICLSNSSYHPELWQPAWGIRTMIEALRSHFDMPGEGSIGALDWPSDLRKTLAKESLDFVCPPSKLPNRTLLPELSPEEMKEENEPMPTNQIAAAAAALAVTEAAVAVEADAAAVPVPASPSAVTATEGSPALPNEGLRFRGTPAAAPAVAPVASGFESVPAAVPPQPAATPASSSSAELAPRSRRQGTTPGQRRQAPVLMQILKPPSSRREWVLMLVDLLIVLATISFIVVLVDVIRNPPKLLNPLPEARDPQN